MHITVPFTIRILKNTNKFHHSAFARVDEVTHSLRLLQGAWIALAYVVNFDTVK